MKLEVSLAWRNVRRQPRRALLTAGAVTFATFLIVVHVALNDGNHAKIVEDTVRIHSGHVALSGTGFRKERTLEHFLHLGPEFEAALTALPGVQGVAPRVLAFGLLSGSSTTQPAAVLGVDPVREGAVSTLPGRVNHGSFLTDDNDHQIVLGERLAERLGVELGGEVLLYSMAYSLEMAYELFRVTGLVSLPDADLERALAVIGLQDAQAFFVYDDRVNEVAILGSGADTAPALFQGVEAVVSAHAKDSIEIHLWKEIDPQLVEFLSFDNFGMVLMLAVLVVVVAFGILNTIWMSVLERRRELGVLLALGLSRAKVLRMVILESLTLGALGVALGLALSIPLVLWLEGNPIEMGGEVQRTMEFLGAEPVWSWRLNAENPLWASAVLIAVATLASLPPAWTASRSRPVEALRGGS